MDHPTSCHGHFVRMLLGYKMWQVRARFCKQTDVAACRFQNECNKVEIALRVVQFWSEIKLVNTNRTPASRSCDFVIMRLISDQIALRLVQLPLFISSRLYTFLETIIDFKNKLRTIPLVVGDVGDTVVALVCKTFAGVVTKINLKMFSQLVLTI